MIDIDGYLKDGAVPVGIWLFQKVIRTSRLLGRLSATKDQQETRIRMLERNVFGVTFHEEEKKGHEHKHAAARATR